MTGPIEKTFLTSLVIHTRVCREFLDVLHDRVVSTIVFVYRVRWTSLNLLYGTEYAAATI